MNDLLALATMRRILLELGYESPPAVIEQPLELWMRVPRSELDGQSALMELGSIGGEQRVRACLRQLLRHPSPSAGAVD
jgi:hypothetical protein